MIQRISAQGQKAFCRFPCGFTENKVNSKKIGQNFKDPAKNEKQ
jgi:hypothetical protein